MLLCILLFLVGISGSAQQRIEIQIVQANSIESSPEITSARRIIGDVIFEHEGTLLHCDSAYLFMDENKVETFGRSYIHQEDTLKLWSDSLTYDGNSKIARLRKNILFEDNEITLETDYLDYHMSTGVAKYFDDGEIFSKEEKATLKSRRGFYYSKQKQFHFKDNVSIDHDKYDMQSDTLVYNTRSKKVQFKGNTVITSEENKINCNSGWYFSDSGIGSFNNGARIYYDKQELHGDSIYFERQYKRGRAFGNVVVLDTTNDLSIHGHYGMYDNKTSVVTDSGYVVQTMESDTFYLHADTLRLVHDSVNNKSVIYAYPGVRFFMNQMQGACDSMVYAQTDSMIKMFFEPVIWSDSNQLTSQYIQIETVNGNLSEFYMEDAAFVITEIDSSAYNQIAGKEMFGFFNDSSQLDSVRIVGNGQTVYYVVEEEMNADSLMIQRKTHMNKTICSNIEISLSGNQLKMIRYNTKPDAIMYPIDQVNPKYLFLKGFGWFGDRRPKNKHEIFKKIDDSADKQ